MAGKTFGDAPFGISANASSGLPVSFSITGPTTINGNTVTITGLGVCTITAHQTGNGNYNVAADVSQSFTVNITYERMNSLINAFVNNPGVAKSMISKLDNASAAKNSNAKDGMIGAFINEVQAQTGKAITQENAATLITLAKAL